ncbi:reverse transcriptase domain-containing protein [Tanacetum coccineum]
MTGQNHLGTRQEVKEERTEAYSIGWEVKERVCPYTRKAVTRVLIQEERKPFPENVTMKERIHKKQKCSPKAKIAEGDTENPFTPRIRYFDFPKKTRMPSNVNTYDGSDDLEDHLKKIQAAAKVERWAMPTWCHMFNSTLTGAARVWFDDLPPESVDSYNDLKKAFLANFLQQKKCIKDPVEIHHIKQRERESTKDFVQRFKTKSRHVKGSLECKRIFRFMHGITNPELIKRLHDKILKLVNEMMRAKSKFRQEGDFWNQQRSERRRDKFTLLTKSPKEILALDKGKFKTPPPMITPVEKRNNSKFCEFHGEWKGPAKSGKKGRSIRKGQSYGNSNGPTMAKSGQAKDYIKLLHLSGTFALSGSENPNAPSHRTTHWFQQRNHMANGTNIATGKNRGCGTFNLYMDEVRGSKITVSVQRDHKKAKKEGRRELCDLLRCNLDIFAWKPANMTGVSRNIVEHRLNIREGCPSVRQKKRSQAPERNKAIKEEVERLVEAGIMKEVHYHSWLSNPDGYPLQEIDWKVESLCGYPFKCFLDAYKGYHQIKMAKEDEEKTAFITIQGIFCYSKIPFGLKNAGATYQRLVDKAFQKQIGRNLEVYVDDLVIKSRREQEIIRDIEETLRTLREINMKLNPKKCTFGVEEGMLLGYKVNTKGIKVCLEKVEAVLSLPSPKCLKCVQKLNGKLANLKIFMSK